MASELPVAPQGAAQADDPAFERFGRYVPLRRLGAGAMGEVHEAFDPRLERKVAIKLILPERGISEDRAAVQRRRLFAEARSLAQLEHPNIVAVYEVGVRGEEVFVAMEMIEGCSMDQWLQEGERSVPEILAVLVQVGEALAYAHGHGIVHRDVKPANILIGRDGRAYLADFGLAAADGSRGSLDAEISGFDIDRVSKTDAAAPVSEGTQFGICASGTPCYMAPEQFRGRTAMPSSDQFSYCVTAYEALYGVRPFRGVNHGDLLVAIEAQKFQIRGSKATVPRALGRVVLRGLLPDIADRYPDMATLVTVLANYDAGGAKATWPIVAASATVIMAMSIMVPSPQICDRPSTQATALWNPTVSNRLATTLERWGELGRNTAARVREQLDAHIRNWHATNEESCRATFVEGRQSERLRDEQSLCLQRSLDDVEQLVSGLLTGERDAVLRGVQGAHQLSAAERCLNPEEAGIGRRPVPRDPVLASAVEEGRARLDAVTKLERAGDINAAVALFESSIDGLRRIEYPPFQVEIEIERSQLCMDQGDVAPALEALESALLTATREGLDAAVASIKLSLAGIKIHRDERRDLAELLWRDAKSAVHALGTPVELEIRLLRTRALIDNRRGEPARAVDALEAALDLVRVHELKDPFLRMSIAGRLANAYYFLLDFRRAHQLYLELAVEESELLGDAHPSVAMMWRNVALALGALGRPLESLEVARKALHSCELVFGPGHRSCIDYIHALAQRAAYANDLDGALTYGEQVVEIQRGMGRRGSPNLPWGHSVYADALAALGRPSEALEVAREGVALLDQDPNIYPVFRVYAYESLGQHAIAMERVDEAERALAWVQSQRDAARFQRELAHVVSLGLVGKLRLAQHRSHEALAAYREFYEQTRKERGGEAHQIVDAAWGMAAALRQLERNDEAEKYLSQALEIAEREAQGIDGQITRLRFDLAAVQLDLGRPGRAAEFLEVLRPRVRNRTNASNEAIELEFLDRRIARAHGRRVSLDVEELLLRLRAIPGYSRELARFLRGWNE